MVKGRVAMVLMYVACSDHTCNGRSLMGVHSIEPNSSLGNVLEYSCSDRPPISCRSTCTVVKGVGEQPSDQSCCDGVGAPGRRDSHTSTSGKDDIKRTWGADLGEKHGKRQMPGQQMIKPDNITRSMHDQPHQVI